MQGGAIPATAASGEELAQRLAQQLAGTAHRQSTDPTFVSPFAVERNERAAAEELVVVVDAVGGKQDDVTVVVGVVVG